MMSAEHRRPFAAFLLVFALACLIMANGLRTQVVEVLIGAGAPRVLISAIAPDLVLGKSLNNAPESPQDRPEARPEVPATSSGSADQDVDSGATTVTEPPVQTDSRPVTRPRAGNTESKPDQAAGPVVPDDEATPDPAPVPKPEPTPLPGPRPGFLATPIVPPTPLLPGNGSTDEGGHSGSGHGWGHDKDKGRRDEDRDESRRDHDRDESRSGFQHSGAGADRGHDRDDRAYDRGDRGHDRGDDNRSNHSRSDRGSGAGRGSSSGDSRQGSFSDRSDSRGPDHDGHGRDHGDTRGQSGHGD